MRRQPCGTTDTTALGHARTGPIRSGAIRQIVFWPPDRAETDGLAVTHPLHTLRRLIDAPLPFPATGL